jgi:DNA-directed RNA polymerase subunit beta'
VVVDWRATPRGSDLKPAIVIKEAKGGKLVRVARGVDARYLLPVEAVLSVDQHAKVKAGDVLARSPIASAKTGDITGGLPRVAELFEARKPKDNAIIAEISGTVEFGKDFKNKQRITIKPDDETGESKEYLIPRGKSLAVQHGDRIEKGDYVYDGHPAPHDILAIKGVEELANYLINEIQDVYRLQGVTINDKHIEVIVRQMLQKVEVEDPGDSEFLKSEQVDRIELDEYNLALEKAGKRPATAKPVLLGITKASLQTRSFISAASFQETTRVLTDAAVNGKTDTLEGLKENVIVGRLIPAGTGGMLRRLRKEAMRRDELIAKERAKFDAARALEPPAEGMGGLRGAADRRRRRPSEAAAE